ncbi:MAG: hypothetical protein ACUVTL_09845 [Thermoproteota archaeon]
MTITQKSTIADVLASDGLNINQTNIASAILIHFLNKGKLTGFVDYTHQSSSRTYSLPFLTSYQIRKFFQEERVCPERTAWYVMRKLEKLGYVQKGRDGRKKGYFLSLGALKRHRNCVGAIQRFLKPITKVERVRK